MCGGDGDSRVHGDHAVEMRVSGAYEDGVVKIGRGCGGDGASSVYECHVVIVSVQWRWGQRSSYGGDCVGVDMVLVVRREAVWWRVAVCLMKMVLDKYMRIMWWRWCVWGGGPVSLYWDLVVEIGSICGGGVASRMYENHVMEMVCMEIVLPERLGGCVMNIDSVCGGDDADRMHEDHVVEMVFLF